MDICRAAKNLNHPTCTLPAELEHGDALLSHFSFYIVKLCPFYCLFSDMLFTFFDILLVVLFKMVPKHSAKVLSSVPKCKKVVMGLPEKM